MCTGGLAGSNIRHVEAGKQVGDVRRVRQRDGTCNTAVGYVKAKERHIQGGLLCDVIQKGRQ
jgi:hypothetical protein